MAKEMTHQENVLTQHVLLPDQRADGYTLREDDHNVFICKEDKVISTLSAFVTSDKIREEVDRLRKEEAENKVAG